MATEQRMKIPRGHKLTDKVWPNVLPDAPQELVDLIAAAMVDFGPAHADGADVIAAVAYAWVTEKLSPDVSAKPQGCAGPCGQTGEATATQGGWRLKGNRSRIEVLRLT
jgi:hypothetical protein